jgi:hypothetical protein
MGRGIDHDDAGHAVIDLRGGEGIVCPRADPEQHEAWDPKYLGHAGHRDPGIGHRAIAKISDVRRRCAISDAAEVEPQAGDACTREAARQRDVQAVRPDTV